MPCQLLTDSLGVVPVSSDVIRLAVGDEFVFPTMQRGLPSPPAAKGRAALAPVLTVQARLQSTQCWTCQGRKRWLRSSEPCLGMIWGTDAKERARMGLTFLGNMAQARGCFLAPRRPRLARMSERMAAGLRTWKCLSVARPLARRESGEERVNAAPFAPADFPKWTSCLSFGGGGKSHLQEAKPSQRRHVRRRIRPGLVLRRTRMTDSHTNRLFQGVFEENPRDEVFFAQIRRRPDDQL